jgi:tetratricopeptide (TPR) repeat protein
MGTGHSTLHAEYPHPLRRIFPFAITALIAAASCFAACANRGSSIAGREPIKTVVKVENNVDALRTWASHGARASALVHIDFSDDMAIFPASQMGDMENAARALRRRDVSVLDAVGPMIERGGIVSLGYMAGMYKRVIWVVPSTKPASETPIDVFKNFLVVRRNIPAAALGDFKVEGAHITGSVAGIPLTITRLADLALGEGENAIIDIDLYYFPMAKLENPAYRVGTASLLEFLRELGGRNIRANVVTVNLSTQNSLVTMDLRYFGDVIREALMNPADLTGPMPEKWRYMIQAEDSLVANRYASAAAIYEDLLRTVKDDAGLYFSLALALGFQDKGPECRAALLNAYRLDGEYLKGFFQLARVLANAGKITAGLAILDTSDLGKIMSKTEMDYQRGVFYYTAHKPDEAIKYLSNVARNRPQDFGLFTILLRAYREAGNDRGQIFALQKLIDIDDGRVKREMPWVYADLGDLYAASKQYMNARPAYERYMQVHPDDSLAAVFRKRIDTWKTRKLLAP